MTAQCNYFSHLETRLSDLKEKFLAEQIQEETTNPTTFLPDLDKIAAFKLLMHAEIEEFLELKAKENLERIDADSALMSTLQSLSFLGIFYITAVTDQKFEYSSIFNVGYIKTYIAAMIISAKKIIKDNNGIKAESFNRLSIFAGKTPDEIESTLLSNLNSYGKSRGDIAHKSTVRTSTMNGPSTEFASAKTLVDELGAYFDVSA